MTQTTETATLFGQWLRQRRRSLDLTQISLAAQLGCSPVTIRKFETGERKPSQQLAELLATIVGIVPQERSRFVRFARTDMFSGTFAHPAFHEPTQLPEVGNGEAPGWVNVASAAPWALANNLFTLNLQAAPSDAPISESLSDGRQICKIAGRGHVSGKVRGTITQDTTHFRKDYRAEGQSAWLSVLFEIAADAGIIKGYYAGFSTDRHNGTEGEGTEDTLRMRGQVLSVTSAYIDLFMADIFYEGTLYYPKALEERATLEMGVLTIIPR